MKVNSLFKALVFKSDVERSLNYEQWIHLVEPSTFQERRVEEELSDDTLLSIILVANPNFDVDLINTSIASCIDQITLDWELLLVATDISMKKFACRNSNVRFVLVKNSTIYYERVNIASKDVKGKFITFLHEGDQLSRYTVEQLGYHLTAGVVVSDEDLLNDTGQRYSPCFKPEWNPDYLSNYNYFSQGVIYNTKLFKDLGGFRGEEDPLHDLALRATSSISENQICHLDKVLFHFKQATKNKINRIQFDIPKPEPLVTIIVPTRDKLELLKPCIVGLLENTTYANFEVIIIDNNSEKSETLTYLDKLAEKANIIIMHYDKPFNYSDMNNLAVRKAKGELVCFLNNDVSSIKDDWLTEMVFHACRPEIGCVGAKLFYPDGTIQHAGVILGLKGYASHAHKGFAGSDPGYFNRLIVTHNVSAVTAACMVMRKDLFEEVGGFDAQNLKVAYNDVDLCLKVREAGYRNLFTPHAQLIHHESKTRGKKRDKKQQEQLREESDFLVKKWGDVLYSDPAYNKNLTLLREDFSLGMDRLKQ